MQTLWKFKTAHLVFTLECEDDDSPDLSFDETGETQRMVDSGEWQCLYFRVTIYHRQTGAELAREGLGNSVYADPRTFRTEHLGARGKWGSYFPDMVRTACTEARATLSAMHAVRIRTA